MTDIRLWSHADNAAWQSVAERVGFTRDPARDEQKQVKAAVWDTVAYRKVVGDIQD